MAFYELGSLAKFPDCTEKALLAFPDLEKNFFAGTFSQARSPRRDYYYYIASVLQVPRGKQRRKE